MYGPPPDPQQVYAPASFADAPFAWILCVVVGLTLAWIAGPRRPLPFILGVVVALTTPLAALLPQYVYGAFPTIDKAGSLLFYLDGVHRRLFDPTDPALRLIGVHVGHLWITAFFDLFLQPFAAMNAQGLLNLVLSWWAAARFIEALVRARVPTVGANNARYLGLLFGFPFGMGLHQLRDLNWYTIEKTSLYWLPLYAWSLLALEQRSRPSPRAERPGWPVLLPALAAFGAFFTNIYLGLLCALYGAYTLLVTLGRARERRALPLALLLSAVAPLPLLGLQWRLMHGEGSLGTPELFLAERAALDVFTLWPPAWNRLEAWRALNLPSVALAAIGVLDRRTWRWLGLAGLTFVLALGPSHNPLYLLLFQTVPGFWRVARPETFFHLTWLMLLAAAALSLARFQPRPRTLGYIAIFFAVGWLLGVRTHPVFPQFTLPVPVQLAPDWRRALPGADSLPR